VKFRDILLTGTAHRHRRLNRDGPGQTGTYGRSNLNQNLKPKPKSNFRFIRERPLLFLLFTKSAAPGHCPSLSGPCFGARVTLMKTKNSGAGAVSFLRRLRSHGFKWVNYL